MSRQCCPASCAARRLLLIKLKNLGLRHFLCEYIPNVSPNRRVRARLFVRLLDAAARGLILIMVHAPQAVLTDTGHIRHLLSAALNLARKLVELSGDGVVVRDGAYELT